MTTSIVAALAAGLLVAGAAQAQVKLYGQAHLAINHTDDGADYSARSVSSNSSRLGFKADKEFSQELQGLIQVEGQLDFNSNNNTSLTSRDTYLGLAGSWGLVRAGYFDTPGKLVAQRVDLFRNQVGDNRNLARGNYASHQGFDERFRNGIAYSSPTWNDLSLDLHYSADADSNSDAADGNANDAWSLSLDYESGPIYAAISHEQWNSVVAAEERHATRFGAYWDVGQIRIVGLVQSASDPDDTTWGLGLRYAVTPKLALRTQFYQLNAEDSEFDATLFAVGAEFNYGSGLRFYLNYAQVDNNAQQVLAPWREASTLGRAGAPDETALGVALGAMYSF
jgi:predicted porin